jgi:hypothetical protein
MARTGSVDVLLLSDEELKEYAERSAKTMLGVSWATAIRMLDLGQLDGTIAEAELKGLRYLIEGAKEL